MPDCPTCATPYPLGTRYCAEDGTPLPFPRPPDTVADAPSGKAPGPDDILADGAEGESTEPRSAALLPSGPRSAGGVRGPDSEALAGTVKATPAQGTVKATPGSAASKQRAIAVAAAAAAAKAPAPLLAAAPTLDTNIGLELGNYKVTRLIGRGGMGSVYLAEHRVIGKRAAAKLMVKELIFSEEAVARFEQEARAAAAIGHDNIVEIFDFGRTTLGHVFILMELLEGRSLAEVLEQEGPMNASRIAPILRQIADGLGAAHERGIIHRDMKPDNVFLARRAGRHEVVKLLDFGIAKLANLDASTERPLTAAGMIVGTPHYMAPEQAEGRPVDARSDVYSVGIIMYQLLTGRVPFSAETLGKLMLQHVQQPPMPLRRARPDLGIGARVEQVILRSLVKDASGRWQSMRDFADAFKQAVRKDMAAEAAGPAAGATPSANIRDTEVEGIPSPLRGLQTPHEHDEDDDDDDGDGAFAPGRAGAAGGKVAAGEASGAARAKGGPPPLPPAVTPLVAMSPSLRGELAPSAPAPAPPAPVAATPGPVAAATATSASTASTFPGPAGATGAVALAPSTGVRPRGSRSPTPMLAIGVLVGAVAVGGVGTVVWLALGPPADDRAKSARSDDDDDDDTGDRDDVATSTARDAPGNGPAAHGLAGAGPGATALPAPGSTAAAATGPSGAGKAGLAATAPPRPPVRPGATSPSPRVDRPTGLTPHPRSMRASGSGAPGGAEDDTGPPPPPAVRDPVTAAPVTAAPGIRVGVRPTAAPTAVRPATASAVRATAAPRATAKPAGKGLKEGGLADPFGSK